MNKPPVNDSVLLAVALWKLKKSGACPDGVSLNLEDIIGFNEEAESGKAVLFHHWHRTSVDLKILSKDAGDKLAQIHVENTGGTASYRQEGPGHTEGE